MNRHLRVLAVVLTIAAATVLFPAVSVAGDGKVRHYYVRAEEVVWDYAPSGMDLTHNQAIPDPWTNSHVFNKVRYIEYTDETFSTPKPQPQWLGVLGPILRAEVGDTLKVHFCNGTSSGHYGMHPHGVRYTKDNEGAHYMPTDANGAVLPAGAGSHVMPGECYDYSWFADAGSGPGPADPSSLVWWYHSHIDEPAETNAGLLGAIIITRKGWAREDGSPKDVDREFITAYFIFNELDGAEEGLMHSINGYIYGNLRGLVANYGERVRWYVMGMGNEVDLHTPHWHGKTLRYQGRNTDVIEILPASMAVADMKADNRGTWMMHCHVSDHIDAGMMTTYTIK
jgi:FtsP/CotA-like multicopper oxidase with cupredoxin domain